MVSQKVKKQVVDYLQRAIVAGQLPPEKKLIETEIAEKLAVSRSPVRSAFKELADMGLVEMVPNKGAYVAAKSLTPKEYVERLEFLELLLIQFLFYQEKRSELLNERALTEILKKIDDYRKQRALIEEEMLKFFELLTRDYPNKYYQEVLLQTASDLIRADFKQLTQKTRPFGQLFLYHYEVFIKHVSENNFPLARREVRLWINNLKLEIVDQQDLGDWDKYRKEQD
ncbi:winged helix-turn-helix domain-containing protein [Vagococcus lutrae]|uniref:winged helix-turn-helix domain-containing protein n=1 Tax=Vagococcus lutrae TaxID=81947 RepID=UPI00288D8DCA|nr:winged helix-turn-helix domain-containing protein [Vagococcus lutrae]MDT2800699.1 winged helix-turn-helix domain-containing protein [Vagococcus lutrae]MDT2825542.1 winged helix-turn-helix domain-containing protein [Vagococcus lutrae]MDT2842000.1 winged helix-turn-helix domain-containing protein [Vagococcus lutrae]